jgi:hypothetical protein
MQVLEAGFVLAQTPDNPDPFVFTTEYYGFSESAQYPGFLGYEIETIRTRANTSENYWDPLIDGVPSHHGADTTYPNPGGSITWRYVSVSSTADQSKSGAKVVKSRRTLRSEAMR